jgi:probable HAF family extracellular repeat protein
MKPSTCMWMPVVSLFAALAMSIGVTAQDNASPDYKPKHHQYKLIDLGTFGGPDSLFSTPSLVINNRGTVAGLADTSIPDPYDPNCFFDCLVDHAFVWKNGVTTDLGTLPGGSSSWAYWINNGGLIVGVSQNGLIDPLTGFPEADGVLWNKGHIANLGTLGGNQSSANAINDQNQIVGGALNTILDPYSSGITESFLFFTPAATQARATLWQNGVIHDLGTLGGNDAVAEYVNERGQIAGVSYTSAIPNPGTGIPTIDPFLWVDSKMRDLGTLGGTFGFPTWINNFGQVVGQSNLTGDETHHPFLSTGGRTMKDLGTLGGDTGSAFWINDDGEIVGQADLPGSGAQTHHGFLWKHGAMTDLGTVDGDPCSVGLSINLQGQIAGASTDCTEYQHAFLWENGGPMIDLNTLIIPGSGLIARDADYINDSGEIAGRGVLPNGDVHAILLVPDGDCDDDCEGRIAAGQNNAAPMQYAGTMKQGSELPASRVDQLRNRFGRGYHLSGQPPAPRD